MKKGRTLGPASKIYLGLREGSIAAVATATAVAAAATIASATTTTAEATRAAATTTTTAVVAAAEAAFAGSAFFTGAGNVHREGAAIHLETMEFFDRFLSFVAGGHGDEGESAGAAGEFVEDDFDDADGADLAEQGLEILRGASEGKVPHVELTVVHLMMRADAAALPPVPDFRV